MQLLEHLDATIDKLSCQEEVEADCTVLPGPPSLLLADANACLQGGPLCTWRYNALASAVRHTAEEEKAQYHRLAAPGTEDNV